MKMRLNPCVLDLITETKEPDFLDTSIRDFVKVITADLKKNGLFSEKQE